MILKKTEQKEDGVSPVVGVMLMLVVTIIIAAVVAAFASGMGGGITSTPTVVFTTQNINVNNGGLASLDFAHRGGDELSLGDIRIVLEAYGTIGTYTLSNGGLSAPYGSTIIGSGDIIHLKNSGSPTFTSSSPVTWSIIDIRSGNKIATGDFVVPGSGSTSSGVSSGTTSGDSAVTVTLTANPETNEGSTAVTFTITAKDQAGVEIPLTASNLLLRVSGSDIPTGSYSISGSTVTYTKTFDTAGEYKAEAIVTHNGKSYSSTVSVTIYSRIASFKFGTSSPDSLSLNGADSVTGTFKIGTVDDPAAKAKVTITVEGTNAPDGLTKTISKTGETFDLTFTEAGTYTVKMKTTYATATTPEMTATRTVIVS